MSSVVYVCVCVDEVFTHVCGTLETCVVCVFVCADKVFIHVHYDSLLTTSALGV